MLDSHKILIDLDNTWATPKSFDKWKFSKNVSERQWEQFPLAPHDRMVLLLLFVFHSSPRGNERIVFSWVA